MKNICFMANYNKTYLFEKIANNLESKGIRVFWITVNTNIYKYLTQAYGEDVVFLINKKYTNKPSEPLADLRINEIIYGDRVLRYFKADGIKLLINIQRPIYHFIKSNNIHLIFGELTWAHEILVHRITKKFIDLHCTYLVPHTVRIPNNRFSFFTDEFHSEILELTSYKYPKGRLNHHNSNNNNAIKVAKPDYLALNDKIIKRQRSLLARILKIKRFITEENIDPLDPTLISNRWLRLKLRIIQEINTEMYRFVRCIKLEDAQRTPYIFLALHKQPEASIDVIGRYHENQLQNIIDIWRILPHGWRLVVKEHTNAIGDRSYSFYRKVQSLPNVVLVDEQADSHELIKKSKLVITVSGTVAYEAALLGTPSATIGPVFFNKLSNCLTFSGQNFGDIDIEKLSEYKSDPVCIKHFNDWIFSVSSEGIISDPVSDTRCMTEENILNVADKIYNLLKHYDQQENIESH